MFNNFPCRLFMQLLIAPLLLASTGQCWSPQKNDKNDTLEHTVVEFQKDGSAIIRYRMLMSPGEIKEQLRLKVLKADEAALRKNSSVRLGTMNGPVFTPSTQSIPSFSISAMEFGEVEITIHRSDEGTEQYAEFSLVRPNIAATAWYRVAFTPLGQPVAHADAVEAAVRLHNTTPNDWTSVSDRFYICGHGLPLINADDLRCTDVVFLEAQASGTRTLRRVETAVDQANLIQSLSIPTSTGSSASNPVHPSRQVRVKNWPAGYDVPGEISFEGVGFAPVVVKPKGSDPKKLLAAFQKLPGKYVTFGEQKNVGVTRQEVPGSISVSCGGVGIMRTRITTFIAEGHYAVTYQTDKGWVSVVNEHDTPGPAPEKALKMVVEIKGDTGKPHEVKVIEKKAADPAVLLIDVRQPLSPQIAEIAKVVKRVADAVKEDPLRAGNDATRVIELEKLAALQDAVAAIMQVQKYASQVNDAVAAEIQIIIKEVQVPTRLSDADQRDLDEELRELREIRSHVEEGFKAAVATYNDAVGLHDIRTSSLSLHPFLLQLEQCLTCVAPSFIVEQETPSVEFAETAEPVEAVKEISALKIEYRSESAPTQKTAGDVAPFNLLPKVGDASPAP